MNLLWWHWLVAGMALVMLELLVPAFVLIWLGIAALCVGVTVLLVELSFGAQFFLWGVLSLVMMWGWFKVVKSPDRTQAGSSKQGVIGIKGLVTRDITELAAGEIMFQQPVLGADRWPAVAEEVIAAGERAVIVDVQSQVLKVARAR